MHARNPRDTTKELLTFSPRVSPDPDAAAELERRRQALRYSPATGFLTDRKQERRRS